MTTPGTRTDTPAGPTPTCAAIGGCLPDPCPYCLGEPPVMPTPGAATEARTRLAEMIELLRAVL